MRPIVQATVLLVAASDLCCGARTDLEALRAATEGPERFIAYVIQEGTPDDVIGVEQPEVYFAALEGPGSALDGETHVIDFNEPGPWVFRFNMIYAGDTDVCWYVIELSAGVPGARGEVIMSGTVSPPHVELLYDVGYSDPAYPMPCFSELVDIGTGYSTEFACVADVVLFDP